MRIAQTKKTKNIIKSNPWLSIDIAHIAQFVLKLGQKRKQFVLKNNMGQHV